MIKEQWVIVVVLGLLTACSSPSSIPGNSGVIVDTKNTNMANYEVDLKECETYAGQVPTAERTATGAVSGAVVGGAIGGIRGGSDRAVTDAGVGAVLGGTAGVASSVREMDRVVKNCMRGRGYRVLN